MSNCTVHVSGFTGPYASLNGTKNITITTTDIAWGLITTGKTHWLQIFRDPFRETNDFIHNLTGLNTYIDDTPQLCVTDRFSRLDGSEKRIKSYNIGMGITKVVADKILRVPYLLHVDDLIGSGRITTSAGTLERGDLIGEDHKRNWHVFEAKGRSSNPPSPADVAKAKRQATKINSIDGIRPDTKNVCITHISKTGTEIHLIDPDGEPSVDITTAGDLIKYYYDNLFSGFYSIRFASLPVQTFGGLDFTILGEINQYRFGLLTNVFDELQVGSMDFLQRLDLQASQLTSINTDLIGAGKVCVGSDGIIILDENRS